MRCMIKNQRQIICNLRNPSFNGIKIQLGKPAWLVLPHGTAQLWRMDTCRATRVQGELLLDLFLKGRQNIYHIIGCKL